MRSPRVTAQHVLRAQAAYYLASGLLPIVSMPVFERVTGPKTDRWLVQMVGLLAASIGISLLLAARRKEVDTATLALAVASALSFAGIDIVHSARGRISRIYLADAIVEAAFVGLLLRTQ
jgi:hypothetical protein